MGQEVQTEKHQEERPAQSHTNRGLQLQLLPMVLSRGDAEKVPEVNQKKIIKNTLNISC